MLLHKLPDEGRVLLANPSDQVVARCLAGRRGLDHVLDKFIPHGQFYVMDVAHMEPLPDDD